MDDKTHQRRPLVACIAVAWAVLSIQHAQGEANTLQVDAMLTLAESVEVPARESGVVIEMLAQEGERVEAGSLLAKIDDRQARFDRTRAQLELEAARREAENNVRVQIAEKSHALARQDWERGMRLNRERPGTVSDEEIEERRLQAEATELEIRNVKNQLEIAKTTQAIKSNEVALADFHIERRTIVTLVSGFVARVEVQLGEWVEAGTTVFRIVRDDRLFAEAFVSLNDVRTDLTGFPVTVTAVTVDGRPTVLHGTVTYFSPHVGTLDGEVRLRAELKPSTQPIAAGQRVTMVIDMSSKRQVGTPVKQSGHAAIE